MSQSHFINFAALKAAVTMEEVLDHYGLLAQLNRTDDSLSGKCPIHKGHNPTEFRVSISKNCWNCFSSCRGGGGVIDFVQRMENCQPLEAAHHLVQWFDLDIAALNGDRRSRPACSTVRHPTSHCPAGTAPEQRSGAEVSTSEVEQGRGCNPPLRFTLGDKLQSDCDYLRERGLNADTILEFGIGLCNGGSLNGYIAIPIYNANAQLVAYAGRFPGVPPKETPKYRLPKGFKKSLEVYNLSRALKEPEGSPLIVVEGFFDVMHLWQRGIRKVVALMGPSLSVAQEELILSSTPAHSSVLLLFDEDTAGRAGREVALVRLARHRFVRVVPLPMEGQQPEDLTAAELTSLFGGVS